MPGMTNVARGDAGGVEPAALGRIPAPVINTQHPPQRSMPKSNLRLPRQSHRGRVPSKRQFCGCWSEAAADSFRSLRLAIGRLFLLFTAEQQRNTELQNALAALLCVLRRQTRLEQ